jgi:hypothetical protein
MVPAAQAAVKLSKGIQFFARRQNDILSTNRVERPERAAQQGARDRGGKKRSRRNAVRHGLTAETVVDELEDAEDYGRVDNNQEPPNRLSKC